MNMPDRCNTGRMETHLDNGKDLCVLAPPVVRDRLTKLLEGPLAFLFRVSLSGNCYLESD